MRTARVFWTAAVSAACGLAGGTWELDGDLRDGSAAGHDAMAKEVAFVESAQGRGLGPGCLVEVPDAPDLRLHAGFEAECRFRMDARPPGAQVLLAKDKEYLLRVDWEKEGGQLSFFVHVGGGWEPRVRGPVVRTGEWYDTKVKWDGRELSLFVGKDQMWSRQRPGVPAPTENPLQIGPFSGVIDRVEIRNPGFARSQAFAAAADAPGSPAEPRYGDARAWSLWRPVGGATAAAKAGGLEATFPGETSLLVSPPLAVEAGDFPFLCLDAEGAADGLSGEILVQGGAGVGTVPFSVPARGRTLIVAGPEFEFWQGTVRRLGLRFAAGAAPVMLRRFVLSASPEGRPFLRVRSFAAGRAKLRAGREETLVAVVNNLGAETSGLGATLEIPDGVVVLDEATRRIEFLGRESIDLLTWRVRADRPVAGEARVVVAGPEGAGCEGRCAVSFLPPAELPRTGYVPEPMPARTDYIGLMHYCALWKEGTHYGWGRIEPWPERRPAIGWYDEGTPEVADWHIKYALDHGISGFIYCWYRTDLEPEIHQMLGHAIHEGLHEARYRDRFRYTIMWENGCAEGVKDADDLLDNLFPFWMENYFTHPSYLRIDNCPVLFVWRPEKVGPQLGGAANTRRAFGAMRDACRRRGFDGLRIIGCLDRANPVLQERLAAEGWDATSGYGLRPEGEATVGSDCEGIPYSDHAATLKLYRREWEARRDAGPLPDIPNVMMGWDPRPWHGAGTRTYRASPTAASFEAACQDAKALVDAKPTERWDRRLVVFDNWTEFGEGHYAEPTSGFGFGFVNAIKRVFCTHWAPEELTDVVPADVGLAPPERRYQAVRAAYGSQPPWRPRRITGDLIAHWDFDAAGEGGIADGSGNGFTLASATLATVPGRGGKVLACGDGAASYPANEAFFPPRGVTVALWCRPTAAKQSDRWFLSTVRSGADGYRLGLTGGRAAWQVPKTKWSHLLQAPAEVPVGTWSHVAATFDNRVLRLYVNGTEVASLPRPGLLRFANGPLNVGSFGGSRACFAGEMDDVRVYNRPLSGDEIRRLVVSANGR